MKSHLKHELVRIYFKSQQLIKEFRIKKRQWSQEPPRFPEFIDIWKRRLYLNNNKNIMKNNGKNSEKNVFWTRFLPSSYLITPYSISSKGHSSNWHTAEFILRVKPKMVIITHISEANNSPGTALCEIEEYLFFVIVNPTTRSTIISK